VSTADGQTVEEGLARHPRQIKPEHISKIDHELRCQLIYQRGEASPMDGVGDGNLQQPQRPITKIELQLPIIEPMIEPFWKQLFTVIDLV